MWEDNKRNDHKIFHLSAKLIAASGSVIDEAFKPTHQRIIIKIENSAGKDWIANETIVKNSIKTFKC